MKIVYALVMATMVGCSAVSQYPVSCPDLSTFKRITIPGSFNSFVTSLDTEGYGFGSMTDVNFNAASGRLEAAAVQNTNGYWSFNCLFTDGATQIEMGSSNWNGWEHCAFEGENKTSRKCDPATAQGSRHCRLSCASKPEPDRDTRKGISIEKPDAMTKDGCASDLDCNHAGTCQAETGHCLCDHPFHGTHCENFTLYSYLAGQGGFDSNHPNLTTSWGGSVVQADDGTYHMYAAMMSDNAPLSGWLHKSVVGHAVSKTGLPEGPYAFSDVALGPRPGKWDGTTCHNPDVQRTNDGRFVIYYMGSQIGGGSSGIEYNQRVGMAYSSSPYGPWDRFDEPIIKPGPAGSWDDGFTTNPAGYMYPNGSVLLIYKARSIEKPGAMYEGIAFADSWNSSYEKLSPKPLDLDPKCEDAGIYRAPSGIFRMLTHCGCDGQYMWSTNGLEWNRTTSPQPWCTGVEYVDGTTDLDPLVTRQRPKWLVDRTTGVATHVFTGVNRPKDTGMGHTWTMAATVTPPTPPPHHPVEEVPVHLGGVIATTDVTSLTSVTMDICLGKQRFPFDDETLLAYTKHLGGGNAILRVGGSDQNDFYYDLNDNRTEPFSRSDGGPCCPEPGDCKKCKKDCTMPGPYWKRLVGLAKRSGHKLMFGMVPDINNASSLVEFSSKEGLDVYAYTYGNEKNTEQVIQGYKPLRNLINNPNLFPNESMRPLLAGPDVALQRHSDIETAYAGNDSTINQQLLWVRNFTLVAGSSLDVVSWHTYDFHTKDFGSVDHESVIVNNLTSRLWGIAYLDYVNVLLRDMRNIRDDNAPEAKLWLTESDSVCHQGTDGVTNAFLNSVWLVHRLSLLAAQNVSVMARQSLIGYNYSLLSNWPVEPINPNPDYYTTILFRRLVGNKVLDTTTNDHITHITHGKATRQAISDDKSSSSNDEGITREKGKKGEAGKKARVFAFCAGSDAGSKAGGVTLVMINMDDTTAYRFSFDHHAFGAAHDDYLLSPGSYPVVPEVGWSSRSIRLNGVVLDMKGGDQLPTALTQGGRRSQKGDITLTPLTVGFAVFPDALHPAC